MDELELIRTLANLIDEDQRKNFVIFGSAAIKMNGVDLGRTIADFDVFVAEETFATLATRFAASQKNGNDGIVPFYAPAENIEILKSFPGVVFDDVAHGAGITEVSFGFPVGNLDDLRKWKTAQGRDKDKVDIKRIDAYLSR